MDEKIKRIEDTVIALEAEPCNVPRAATQPVWDYINTQKTGKPTVSKTTLSLRRLIHKLDYGWVHDALAGILAGDEWQEAGPTESLETLHESVMEVMLRNDHILHEEVEPSTLGDQVRELEDLVFRAFDLDPDDMYSKVVLTLEANQVPKIETTLCDGTPPEHRVMVKMEHPLHERVGEKVVMKIQPKLTWDDEDVRRVLQEVVLDPLTKSIRDCVVEVECPKCRGRGVGVKNEKGLLKLCEKCKGKGRVFEVDADRLAQYDPVPKEFDFSKIDPMELDTVDCDGLRIPE